MLLPFMNHSALAVFAQRTRIPISARSTGFCVIWVCISSSSTSTITLARSAEGTEQRRALFNAETVAEVTYVWFQFFFMNSFQFREG